MAGKLWILSVNFQASLVGTLSFDDDYHFDYDADWLKHGFPISPSIPFSGTVSSDTMVNFITNFFPEGEAFDVLLESLSIRKGNVHAVLQEIGRDLTGAITFGSLPSEKTELRLITSDEIAKRLDSGDGRDILFWDGKYRLSVAGVQRKLNVLVKDEQLYLADGKWSSTHILKFAKLTARHLVANEFVCMRLAKAIGLNVATVEVRHFGEHPALLVERFDRRLNEGLVNKRHIIDGCQALDLPVSHKYEQPYGSGEAVAHVRDGASLLKLFDFCKGAYIDVPAKALTTLIDWVLFNLIIGNSDAHAKNISFIVGTSLQIAPFYDLVSVCFEAEEKPNIDINLAMAVGDNFDPNSISAYDLLNFAAEVGVKGKLVEKRLARMVQLIDSEIGVLDLAGLHDIDRPAANALMELISSRSRAFSEQLAEFDFVRESQAVE